MISAIDPMVALGLCAGLIVLQVPLRGLARCLGGRLPLVLSALSVLLPLILLAPCFDRDRTLVPTGYLRQVLPGATLDGKSDLHGDQLNDVVLQILPWELEVRKAFARGRLAFWSDTLDGGSSPWVNPQAGVLAPISLAARLFPFRYFLIAALAFKLAIAIAGAGFLARRLGMGTAAASIVAVGFGLGGGMLGWALFPLSSTLAFVPWLVAGTLRLVRRPSFAALLSTAVVAAAVLLSGHPEVAAAGGLFAGFLGALVLRRGAGLSRRLGAPALAALLGFCLAAPQLLPFLAALPGSLRVRDRALASSSGAAPESRGPAETNATLFVQAVDGEGFGRPYSRPETLWPITSSSYAGAAAWLGVALALLAALDWRRRRLLVLWLLAFWGAILGISSIPLVLPPILRWISVPEYSRFVPVAALAFCLAGGFGFDALLKGRVRARRGLLALAAAIALAFSVRRSEHAQLCWALLAAATLLALPRGLRWRQAAGAMLLVAAVVDGVRWGRNFLPPGDPKYLYPPTPVTIALQHETQLGGPWRVVGNNSLAPAALLSVYGLADVRPHNPLVPAEVLAPLDAAFDFSPSESEYFGIFHHPDHPLLSFLNVRALVSNPYIVEPTTMVRCGGEVSPPYEVWCNLRALPRWFVPSGFDAVPKAGLAAWIRGMSDPRRVALPPGEGDDLALPSPDAALPDTHLVALTPGQVTLDVDGEGERLLASSVPGPRGWHARAPDGPPLRLLSINGAYLGIRVPPGVHRVELRYIPPGLFAGSLLCFAAVAALIGLGWNRRRWA
ncbi:MAG: YfhO family protein [Acidobacteriota bacterium]